MISLYDCFLIYWIIRANCTCSNMRAHCLLRRASCPFRRAPCLLRRALWLFRRASCLVFAIWSTLSHVIIQNKFFGCMKKSCLLIFTALLTWDPSINLCIANWRKKKLIKKFYEVPVFSTSQEWAVLFYALGTSWRNVSQRSPTLFLPLAKNPFVVHHLLLLCQKLQQLFPVFYILNKNHWYIDQLWNEKMSVKKQQQKMAHKYK